MFWGFSTNGVSDIDIFGIEFKSQPYWQYAYLIKKKKTFDHRILTLFDAMSESEVCFSFLLNLKCIALSTMHFHNFAFVFLNVSYFIIYFFALCMRIS